MSRKLLLVMCLMLFMLSACGEREDPSNPKLGNHPPTPKLTAGGKSITTHQSTYCWGKLGCVDYVNPEEMLKDEMKNIVKPNTVITIQIDGKQPNELYLYIDNKDETDDGLITSNQFETPSEPGIYYYALSASWLSEDKKFNEGSSSYAFAIEVKD
ncbi:hypothetical protein ACK8P5_17865 [Paenibacillus sp. EC2-1]|uniref:hypothetical protein n=1 Tax=Paenibacillus sp. EC2-1 TaxID=3388665 RepID=UPI003BEF091D